MPQTPAVPAPAPAAPTPPPAAAPGATALLPDGPLPLEAIPHSTADIRGLRTRRDMLRDQLDRATNRRANIARELNRQGDGALAAEARVGVQRRLEVLDDRIIQLERDQALTERLLASASPDLLATSTTPENRIPRDAMRDEDAGAIAFGTFTFGVVLTLVASRVWRTLRRRRAGATSDPRGTPAALADDARFAQLSQAVDAIAEEVERIGEGQRFVTQLLSTRPEERAIAEPRR